MLLLFRRKKSFTLIELIISAIILGIGISILGVLVISFQRLGKKASYYFTAMNLAKDRVEWMENVVFQHKIDPLTMIFNQAGGRYVGGGISGGFIVSKLNEDYRGHKPSAGDGQYQLLPRRYPESLFMVWNFYFQNASVTLTTSEGASRTINNFTYEDLFFTWKGDDGRRKGMAFGLIPFRYFNNFSVSLDEFYWD